MSKSDFDFRYEFSETRKVLDEFFSTAENEFPAHSNRPSTSVKGSEFDHVSVGGDKNFGANETQDERVANDFNDLNYTLRRFSPNSIIGSTAVGQRLAGNEEELISNTLVSNATMSTSNSIRSTNINSIIADQINFSMPSSSTVSQNNVSLSNHDMIQGIEAQVKGRNDPSNDINAEQHKIPSDTYHFPQQIGDVLPHERAQFISADANISVSADLSRTTPSVATGFRAIDNSTHIPTSDNVTSSTCPSSTNHIITNSDKTITTEQPSKIDTQNIMLDDSPQLMNIRATNSSFVIPTDPNHANTFIHSRHKESEVASIDEVTQSNNQNSSPNPATALVGNMRLNVARHYLAEPSLEQERIDTRNKDLNIIGYENITKDNYDRDHPNGSKAHTHGEKIKNESLKSFIHLNTSNVSENRNVGAVTINTSNASFLSGTLGSEKDNNIVHSMSMMSHSLAPSGPIDSRNFTLSPETTDCDSADLESEVSINEGSYHSSGPKFHTAMPILEDGLSSGHASDLEDDVIYSR